MARGSKSSYTDKQKRQAEHIEESYEERGVSTKEAEARAWATVNRESGGGRKSGSGRKRARKSATKKGGRKTAAKKGGRRKSATRKTSGRKTGAKKGGKKTARRRSTR